MNAGKKALPRVPKGKAENNADATNTSNEWKSKTIFAFLCLILLVRCTQNK